MKSPSTIFIIIAIVILGAGAAYFFLGKNNSETVVSGLVSTNTGATAGVSATAVPVTISTGSQVVELLRNLSTIQLSDAVFQNPSFAMLSDISITIPPISNQGRRNPFAAVGADNPSSETSSSGEVVTPATKVDTSSNGPSF